MRRLTLRGLRVVFAGLLRSSHTGSVSPPKLHHPPQNRARTQHPGVCAHACRQKNFCFAVFFGIMAVFSEISRKVQGCAECFSTGAARAFGPLLQHSIIPKGIPHGHETYLSTVQNPSRTHARLSGSHENPRRPRRYQRSPRQRPQASGCLIAIAFFVTARAAGRCCSNVHLSWQLFAHAFRFCSLACAAKCAAVWHRDAAGEVIARSRHFMLHVLRWHQHALDMAAATKAEQPPRQRMRSTAIFPSGRLRPHTAAPLCPNVGRAAQ